MDDAVTVALERLVHLGAFNSVFLARRRNGDDRLLVAKLYNRTDIQSQPDLAKRVLNERRILEVVSKAPHAFLVGFEGALLTTDAACLCMEAVGYLDLFTLLDETHGPFAPEHARVYIGEITLALGHLHAFDIIHRNVKVRTEAPHGPRVLACGAVPSAVSREACDGCTRTEREHTRRTRWAP